MHTDESPIVSAMAVTMASAIFELLPPTREWARRLGLVTLQQMVRALVASIERGPEGVRMIDVPGIRAAGYSANVMERRPS